RRAADHRLLRHLGGGPGHAALRERLQAAVGGLHPPRRRGRPLEVRPGRRRQGRPAGGARPEELGRASLARRARAGDLKTVTEIALPTADRRLEPYRLGEASPYWTAGREAGPFSRVAIAAAHVVADPLAEHDPWVEPAIDWERTLAYRDALWDLGLG